MFKKKILIFERELPHAHVKKIPLNFQVLKTALPSEDASRPMCLKRLRPFADSDDVEPKRLSKRLPVIEDVDDSEDEASVELPPRPQPNLREAENDPNADSTTPAKNRKIQNMGMLYIIGSEI